MFILPVLNGLFAVNYIGYVLLLGFAFYLLFRIIRG